MPYITVDVSEIRFRHVEEDIQSIPVHGPVVVEPLDVVIGSWFAEPGLCYERCRLEHFVEQKKFLFVNLSFIGICIEVLVTLLIESYSHRVAVAIDCHLPLLQRLHLYFKWFII